MKEEERFPEMEYEVKDEELIRRYLIGELTAEELRTVEERIMTDKEFSDFALFVEDKLVEDYVEGRLSGRDRENFEKLFLSTPQGAEQVRFNRALKEYVEKARASKSVVKLERDSRPSAFAVPRWAFAAAILLIAAIGIWQVFFSKSELDKGIVAFNSAFQERPVEARITEMPYTPRVDTRGAAHEKVDYQQLRRAERIFTTETEERPRAESFHALGRVYLAKGDFDRAIEMFKKAIEFAPDDAQIYSDLGAAYLEKGKSADRTNSGGGVQDFSQSLEYLNKAIDLDQNILDARFNRALVYERSSRIDQAVREWQEYLKRDSNSLWADEAREKIEKLRSTR